MDDMIKVSVILPIYNTKEEFFYRCLESLISQEMKNIEIIIINDGSRENIKKLCDKYGKLDSRIVVVHQENMGVSVARNKGIDMAKGKWITFVDADDWIEPSMCGRMVELAEKWGSEILIFPPIVHKSKIVFENPFFENDIVRMSENTREELQIRTMIQNYPKASYQTKAILTGHTFGKLILRDFLLKSKVRFHEELLLQQDGIFYLELFEKSKRISYANLYLYNYRLYNTSSHMKLRKNVKEIYLLVEESFYNFIKEHEKPLAYYHAYYAKCVSDLSIIIKNDFFNESNKMTLQKKLWLLKEFIKKEPYYTAIKNCNKGYLTKIKRRNLIYYKYKLLLLMWIDWKVYEFLSKQ